jgi:hypothetical protein
MSGSVNIFCPQVVLISAFLESLTRIDEKYVVEMLFAFLKHKNAGRDARAVKDIRGQADNGVQVVAVLDQIFADMSLGHCQVNGGRFKSDCFCGILHRCAPPSLSIIVIASPQRLSVIAFGCIFALP